MIINTLRKDIDQLDFQIVRLLHQRMELALKTAKLKLVVHDPARVESVLANVVRYSRGINDPAFTTGLFKQIIDQCTAIQTNNYKLIGFQGEHGAYGELAGRQYQAEYIPLPCLEFADVFEGVQNEILDYGIVPVENSLEGGIDPVTDLLMATDLAVVAEVYIPVRHCLLSVPETDYRDIKVVYSHPQALGQCRGFISRNRLEPRPFYDTAGSAMMLADERPRAAAAIASKLCADIYNLEVIKEDISDHPSNTTRFLVLSKAPAPSGGDKCSIIFYARHQAGSLYKILSHFSEKGINLTRLESRPLRDDSGNVAFLMDFQGSDQDPAVKTVLETVRREASLMKLLGCYQEDKR